MNIRDFNEYRAQLSTSGMQPGMERIRMLCEYLGNPQDRLRFIHIAGTNGKGSLCAYISHILMAAGLKTGRFTSPAVDDEKERYWINGRHVSQSSLCRNMEEVKAAADLMILKGEEAPTLFEAECALAFLIFVEAGCEIVVLECGMGGANDATNIISTALACAFTSISLDHTRYLGKTVEAIAREKSGIIKQGVQVVSASQVPEVINVLKARATLKRANLTIVDFGQIKNIRQDRQSCVFDYGRMKNIEIPFAGVHQTENAAIAVTLADTLRKSKIKIPEDVVRRGLKETVWPGRFERIAEAPDLILDGAHNEDAAIRLSQTLTSIYPEAVAQGKVIYIYGVLGDKNYPAISQVMSPHAAQIITVAPPNNPRALPAVQLAETVKKYNENVSTATSVEEALEMAYLLADADSVILAFGSLSFLGRVREVSASRSAYLLRKQMKV